MKPLVDAEIYSEIQNKIDQLSENSQRQKGQVQYKHLSQNLKQFKV